MATRVVALTTAGNHRNLRFSGKLGIYPSSGAQLYLIENNKIPIKAMKKFGSAIEIAVDDLNRYATNMLFEVATKSESGIAIKIEIITENPINQSVTGSAVKIKSVTDRSN
jgi:hypothetical protein